MEYKDIKDFFKKNIPFLKADKRTIKRLQSFRLDWSTKDTDYIEFLGSNLLGVHNIRFSILDDEKLMNEILGIKNYLKLQDEIYNVKGIEKNYKVASNIIYQTLMYIAHLFLVSKLSEKDKIKGISECCLIMEYKMFTSIYTQYFKYNTTEAIATTVYNKLSHKFLIKQLNNWQEVFEYRVDSCLDKKSKNYPRIKKYSTEDSILIISNIQTKLREQILEIYSVLVEVDSSKTSITQESSTYIGGENNEEQIRDVTGGIGGYINYMKSIALISNEFLDNEAIDIVDRLFNNINKDIIYDFLRKMSDDTFVDNEIYDIIENILLISFKYLQRSNINIEKREYIPKALVMIRNYWSSSKVKNEEMRKIKEYLNKKAYEATGRKTSWLLVSLSISYIVYIFLRSLKK